MMLMLFISFMKDGETQLPLSDVLKYHEFRPKKIF